jgi:hypothetical protein
MSDSASSEPGEAEPIVIHDNDAVHAQDSEGYGAGAQLSIEASVTAHPGGILITVSLWFIWLEVAVEQAISARRIRANMIQMQAEGKPIADLLNPEFEASVVAIAACAHSLDALYGSQVIPATARNQGQNRPGKIREALKRTFNTGPVNTPWVPEFTRLFDLRDAAVHAGESPSVPELHPVAGYTAKESVTYSKETAEHFVDFTLSVFRWCIDNPRPSSAAWAASIAPLIDQLEQQWSTSNI